MSVDLVVGNPLSSTIQAIQDQNGNSSSLSLSQAPGQIGGPCGQVVIVAPGGAGATAALQLATYPSSPSTPNVQLVATDSGNYDANLSFQFLPAGPPPNPLQYQTNLQLNSNGSLVLPSLPNLPGSGTADLVVDSNGNVGTQLSSARFKEDVEPLAADFHKILALEPKSFTYRESGERSIGYMAEEVDGAGVNDLVSYDAEGKPLSVHYKMIPVYLLEMVKDQQRRLDEQERTIAELREAFGAETAN